MGLTNAERQRRYIQRLKAKAGVVSDATNGGSQPKPGTDELYQIFLRKRRQGIRERIEWEHYDDDDEANAGKASYEAMLAEPDIYDEDLREYVNECFGVIVEGILDLEVTKRSRKKYQKAGANRQLTKADLERRRLPGWR